MRRTSSSRRLGPGPLLGPHLGAPVLRGNLSAFSKNAGKWRGRVKGGNLILCILRQIRRDGMTWTPFPRRYHEGSGMRYASDLTDREWSMTEPFMPSQPERGRRKTSLRDVIAAIFYLRQSGCRWALLSNDFPPESTVHYYFIRFCRDGTWRRIHDALYGWMRQLDGREDHRHLPSSIASRCRPVPTPAVISVMMRASTRRAFRIVTEQPSSATSLLMTRAQSNAPSNRDHGAPRADERVALSFRIPRASRRALAISRRAGARLEHFTIPLPQSGGGLWPRSRWHSGPPDEPRHLKSNSIR